MKQIGWVRKVAYASAGYVYGSCTLLFSALQAVSTVDVENPKGFFEGKPLATRFVEIIQDISIYAYITIGVIVLLCFWTRRMTNPWIIEKIKFVLDGYRNKCFNKVIADPNDHHRVTLFRCERCLFQRHWSAHSLIMPWGANPVFSGFMQFSRYLVPFVRSGHLSQKSAALFYVCDDSDKVEGVAGLAWATKMPIVKTDLPDVTSAKGSRKSQELISDYAAQTKCTPEFVKSYIDRKKPLPRSIAAIPIMVQDKVWGVVVLDSRKPDGVSLESVENYELTVAIIGQLLEKA